MNTVFCLFETLFFVSLFVLHLIVNAFFFSVGSFITKVTKLSFP